MDGNVYLGESDGSMFVNLKTPTESSTSTAEPDKGKIIFGVGDVYSLATHSLKKEDKGNLDEITSKGEGNETVEPTQTTP